MSRFKNLLKILVALAFAVTIMVIPSYAQAQDVDAESIPCPNTLQELWDNLYVYSEAVNAQVGQRCHLSQTGDDGTYSPETDESQDKASAATAEPIDEREPQVLTKGVATTVEKDRTCVGDISIDGHKLYDEGNNAGTTGTIVYFPNATDNVTADFGDVTCHTGDISDDAEKQQMENGCDGGCASAEPQVWTGEDMSADTHALADGMVQVDSNADLGDIPEPVEVFQQGKWTVYVVELVNDPIVADWIERLRDPCPECWPTYPNVQNKLVPEFPAQPCEDNPEVMCVPWGVEYGMDNSPFCEQDQRCDWVTPPQSYVLNTGDYGFHPTTDEDVNLENVQEMVCENTDPNARKGCLILLVNVMDEAVTWRNQRLDNGFRVFGRYWHGDHLEWGVWGIVSHASANMLNMKTYRNPLTGDVLNAGGTNAGGNCGTSRGCPVVDVTVVVHAGDRILAILKTTVTRPTK